jgi:predicted CopG family antitoxin
MDDTIRRKAEQEAMDIMNRAFASIMPREPRWTYYPSLNKFNKSREKDRYFYTTEKAKWKGKTGFASGIRRYNAKKKGWIALKVVVHKRRKDADARAFKLREKEKNGISRPNQ